MTGSTPSLDSVQTAGEDFLQLRLEADLQSSGLSGEPSSGFQTVGSLSSFSEEQRTDHENFILMTQPPLTMPSIKQCAAR